MPNPQSFTEVLREAVADFAEHGYDSQERLEGWMLRIQRAAELELIPQPRVDLEIRRALGTIYNRLINQGGILARHPGISRMTLERVRPELRDELSRAIFASANLIRLNRQQAIFDTIQRFAGWASSIPQGGSPVVKKRDVQTATRKELTQIAYEARRVANDQGHKFAAALDRVVARGSGAIAGQWHRHFTRYPREQHKTRDGKWYLIRNSWAHEQGLVKPGPAGYLDDITQAGEEINCLPGETLIPAAYGVEVAYRRRYCGELIEFTTSSNKSLRSTPNHPVLTRRGWVAAGLLNIGDQVAEITEKVFNSSIPVEPDYNMRISTISEVFATCNRFGSTEEICGESNQFHSDGSNSYVDVVRTDSPLSFGRKSSSYQRVEHFFLTHPSYSWFCESSFLESLQRFFRSSNSFVGWFDSRFSFFFREIGPAIFHMLGSDLSPGLVGISDQRGFFFECSSGESRFRCLRSIPDSDVITFQDIQDDLEILRFLEQESCYLRSRHPSLVQSDNLLSVDVKGGQVPSFRFSRILSTNKLWSDGHVYNLQTVGGWYAANGIILHNCRCTVSYYNALRRLPPYMLTEKGREVVDSVRAQRVA